MNIKTILLGALLPILSGCAVIGIETIAPRKQTPIEPYMDTTLSMGSKHGYWKVNGNDLGISLDNSEGENKYSIHIEGPGYSNCGSPLSSPKQIITNLGDPDLRSENTFRYNMDKRNWKGIALDCAIFPIPLTLPLMVPILEKGYLEIIFDGNDIIAIHEYSTTSKLYALYYDGMVEGAGGVAKGDMSGIWFNRD